MVRISKKTIDGKDYYYLGHTIRKGKKIEKKELYLGREIPQNIEQTKRKFIESIYKEKWFDLCDKIKENYLRDKKSTPHSAKEKEMSQFITHFTYNTNKIEGSTLTFRETAQLLERGIMPKERPLADVREAETHKSVFLEMIGYNKDISLQIILYWHKKLFEQTKKDIAGRIRTHQVAISGSKFMPPFPAELNILLREFFQEYHKNQDKIHPVELSALVHLKFVTIHPFSDGNGRISRILMNFILNKYQYPLLDIPYEKRTGYYNALERSQLKKENTIFVQWFLRRYLKEHQKYLRNKN